MRTGSAPSALRFNKIDLFNLIKILFNGTTPYIKQGPSTDKDSEMWWKAPDKAIKWTLDSNFFLVEYCFLEKDYR